MHTSNRVIYLDLLRIFAMFGVVVIHVSAVAQSYDIGTLTSNVDGKINLKSSNKDYAIATIDSEDLTKE